MSCANYRLSALTNQYTSIIYEYLSQTYVKNAKVLENIVVPLYHDILANLRDLTRESKTFWLSKASHFRKHGNVIYVF